jgi:Tfp pilus assembly protein PilF
LSCLAVLLGLLVGAGLAGWQMLAVPVEQAASQSDAPPATLVENGRGGAAESELASAVAALIDQAKSLWESDPETARKLLEQATALDPNHFEAAFQLARFLTFRKEFPAAILQYRTALRMNDQAPDIYFNLGYIFLSQGDLDQAIENYQTCLALSPPYQDEVLTNLAVCHWQKDNPPQARLLLEQALALNPNNELAHSYRKILNGAVGPEK